MASPNSSKLLPAKDFILLDSATARILEIETIEEDSLSGVAFAQVTPEQKLGLSYYNHSLGKCGGFELLDPNTKINDARKILDILKQEQEKIMSLETKMQSTNVQIIESASEEVLKAFEGVSASHQENWVRWLSSFETRFHASTDPNKHVKILKTKLEEMARNSHHQVEISEIVHPRTSQKSLRARIVGVSRPQEIVVVGGHLDSTVGWFGRGAAPGADDNASGSANVLEAFRLLLSLPRPERSMEFFWYAAEEVGLVGSADIAQSYKSQAKDVIGVLQLDMTLHPGDGPFVLASMTDFTSPWLREVLVQINNVYRLGASILSDQCGYGCSDHASWHRNGFPALMPFESSFKNMNNKIHTAQDQINSASNFEHSAIFTKIAIAFSWELANTTSRQP